MSKFLQNVKYNKKQLENNWINNTIHSHDLFCGCDNPLKHLEYLLKKETCPHLTDAATSTETGGTKENEENTFDEGDLESLFATENDVTEG
ncbi:MAG: hypothetical protein [Anelloviridae sp.]|nr:MAG: hypothetical protein [Anelloviridae sp.]